jgi:HlyD family secretion protein
MGIGNGMRGIGLVGIGLLAGCGQAPPAALGTLEWDRITVPAPAAEVIATVEVREGQQVKAGAVLMQLDPPAATRSSPRRRPTRCARRRSWKN